MLAGFGQVTQQLPKFDIDKHGNRLDKPLDPYGEPLSSNCTTRDKLVGPAVSFGAASLALAKLVVLQTVMLRKVMLHTVMLHTPSLDTSPNSMCRHKSACDWPLPFPLPHPPFSPPTPSCLFLHSPPIHLLTCCSGLLPLQCRKYANKPLNLARVPKHAWLLRLHLIQIQNTIQFSS